MSEFWIGLIIFTVIFVVAVRFFVSFLFGGVMQKLDEIIQILQSLPRQIPSSQIEYIQEKLQSIDTNIEDINDEIKSR